jgi:hypothetical protein
MDELFILGSSKIVEASLEEEAEMDGRQHSCKDCLTFSDPLKNIISVSPP